MATLALSIAGAAFGGALLPAGVSVLGTTITGAVIGQQVGAMAGAVVDQALFAPSGQARALTGPRLTDLEITASTEGAPIPRLYGRARLGGQVIWATPLEEVATTTAAGGSGKGSITGSGSSAATRTDFAYFASFAVALCEGEVTSLGRVWANGAELDLAEHTWRFYSGTGTQAPDSLIAAIEGAGSAPAYRGVAYVVFERMPLAAFGNRLPQLSFEVHRSVDAFDRLVRGTVMIPGSGEFAYATEPVERRVGVVRGAAENTHTRQGGTDWEVALDQLGGCLPNARSTSLVVSWFGTDLRAGACEIQPAVDSAEKETAPLTWAVAGLDRATAPLVSSTGGRAAFGGTPSDQTVIQAIRDLRSRGHTVTLTPFILMDIPAGNALPDPYTGSTSQPVYPWRGRITVAPAPGTPGTPDKTPAAALQVAAFVGSATPADFSVAGESVTYSGPAEWTLRRMVLHYAALAVAAGGVDAFVIGSELRGLTQVRPGPSSYPFVAALVALAVDVKAILGPTTKVTYAADWSEYFGHQPADGSGDVHFHLDPLWASSAIDAVAIDCYWPLADWRDGDGHADRLAGHRSIYDLAYLKSNLFAGEGYDWFYASPSDRDAQVRSPITDGAGKPWVFRYKDLRSWWQNTHYDRPGGVEAATPTSWVPQSKPVWLTELGCPAVDKGANQPNVFIDPKSSESFLPYFSTGERDDLVQRRYLQAFLEAFDPAHAGYVAGANPVSSVYGGRMLDLDHVHVYAWDARPWPAFPANTDVWGDGANWRLGHWLNGRIAAQPLSAVVAAVLDDAGFSLHDTSALDQTVHGYVVDRPMSAREALQPLELACFVDAVESGGVIRFRQRGAEPPVATLSADDLVEVKPGADLFALTRAQETDLPATARILYSSLESDYRQAVAQSRRLVGASGRSAQAGLALVLDADKAARTADAWLFDSWSARELARFSLPPSRLALEPGDLVTLEHAGRSRVLRVTGIGEHGAREIEALSTDPSVFMGGSGATRPEPRPLPVDAGPPLGLFLDLPLLTGNESPEAGYVAAAKVPWPGAVAFYRSAEESGFILSATVTRPATTGVTLSSLLPGPEGRLDKATRLEVRLDLGSLASVTPVAMLGGGNAAAVQAADGSWEVLQFEQAALIAPRTYALTRLLRAQAGTDRAMFGAISAGSRFVLLDPGVTPVALTRDSIGLPFNWRYGPARRDIAHPSYASAAHAFAGLGLRPLSPVHVRGRRLGGDLTLSWIRRTRIGGDAWLASEVPLAEETESYEVDVLSGASVVRTLASTAPGLTYTAAEQIADFGTPPPTVTVRVHQIGALGRGSPREAVV